ncbi:E3 Ubiquitin-Protein Ligase Dzip3 [Manis pentadactyla]|nr:E3 Ubiquitin-Protein Ligase Dzip3 [Manis pentadactyla]
MAPPSAPSSDRDCLCPAHCPSSVRGSTPPRLPSPWVRPAAALSNTPPLRYACAAAFATRRDGAGSRLDGCT